MDTVLVAGMYKPDNPIMKFVTDYGLKAYHVPVLDQKELPNAKMAIVITTNCGHGLMDKVKENYKNKRILYAAGGVSEIKEDFEKEIVAPLQPLLNEMKVREKLLFMMDKFYNPKERFESGLFNERFAKYCTISQPAYCVGLKDAVENGSITKIEGKRGYYVFNGVCEEISAKFSKKFGIKTKIYEDNNKVENEYIPEKPVPVEEIIVAPPATTNDDVKLLYDTVDSLEKKFDSFHQSQSFKMMELTKAMNILTQTLTPKSRDNIINDITKKLERLPMDELIKFNTVFDVLMSSK